MRESNDLISVIQQHITEADLAGPMSEERVTRAEQQLRLRFPPSYRRFLRAFGSGGVGPEEFFGLTRTDGAGIPNAIWYTLDQRKDGLPESMIVVGASGYGTLYCLNITQEDPEGEAPVVEWDPGLPSEKQSLLPIASSFAEFAISAIRDGLEGER